MSVATLHVQLLSEDLHNNNYYIKLMQQNLNLSDDDFLIFNLPRHFELDEGLLEQRWKKLLQQTHPDQFSTEGQTAQRIATQWSMRINEAYQTLKNPLKRAALLCELAQTPVQSESNTAMPTDFLIQQMQWREQLENAHAIADVEHLQHMLQTEQLRLQSSLAWLIDEQGNFEQASQTVRMLMFIERFKKDTDTRLDALDL